MGNRSRQIAQPARATLILAAILGMASCTAVDATVERVQQQVQKWTRTPGEKMDMNPDKVWVAESCGDRRLPFFRMDENEVTPSTIETGEEINHRIIYTMCPNRPYEAIQGQLRTSVYLGSQVVSVDTVDQFEIKPGKWIVDTNILVPKEAQAGVYWLDVVFNSPGLRFKERSNSFGATR